MVQGFRVVVQGFRGLGFRVQACGLGFLGVLGVLRGFRGFRGFKAFGGLGDLRPLS